MSTAEKIAVKDRIDEAAALVRRCQQGDHDAFAALFEHYHQRVQATVYHLVSRKDELDDVVQKVFLEVHRSIGSFEGRSLFSTWLTRVAIHVAHANERRWRVFDRPRRRAREQGEVELSLVEGGREDRPDEALLLKERAQAARELLGHISQKKRQVLVLADMQGLSAPEIADILDIPPATVRTRLFYARRDFERLARRKPQLVSLFGLGSPS